MRAELLPRAHVVTPNMPEAEVLAGMPSTSLEDMHAAARADPRGMRRRAS